MVYKEEKALGKEFTLERVKERLDLLDHRLDNIDSQVTALIDQVMRRPLTLEFLCPHCHRVIEINLVGIGKVSVREKTSP